MYVFNLLLFVKCINLNYSLRYSYIPYIFFCVWHLYYVSLFSAAPQTALTLVSQNKPPHLITGVTNWFQIFVPDHILLFFIFTFRCFLFFRHITQTNEKRRDEEHIWMDLDLRLPTPSFLFLATLLSSPLIYYIDLTCTHHNSLWGSVLPLLSLSL